MKNLFDKTRSGNGNRCVPRAVSILGLLVVALSAFTFAAPAIAPASFSAHAASATPLEDIDGLKTRANAYNGAIVAQKKLGDIYADNIDPVTNVNTGKRGNPYEEFLHEDDQRNRIEAFYWYSLAAAQLDHAEILRDAKGIEVEPLTEEEIRQAKDAKAAMDALRRGFSSRAIKGPSLWAAQSMFAETYRSGCAPAYFIMANYYRNGKIMDKSNYDAYVWMHAAEMQSFPSADLYAEEYRGKILVNQQFLASSEAERLIASCGAIGGSAGTGSGRYVRQGGGASSPGWGTDFQAHRQNREAGNIRVAVPEGVDSHHSSRSAYDMGNGFLAAGDIPQAKAMYEIAIAKEPYSEAAISASRQLQALTLSCSMRDDRVVRMAGTANRDRVHDIEWDRLQLALKALGYYTKYVDNEPGQETRRAIRAFQREELNVDETGYLTTDQRVELICVAAQNVRDADSQNLLGIMYARGIGLNCNTAAARAWFQKSADQGHPSALYNLGLMYLEGYYDRNAPGKYPYSEGEQPIAPRKIVDHDVAKFYFKEAAEKGHPDAIKMLRKIKTKSSSDLAKEHGVIGCIDYEVEEELLTYEERIKSLDALVAGIPGSECNDLRNAEIKYTALRKKVTPVWKSVVKYDRDMGQSDRAVDRMSIGEAEALLNRTKSNLDAKLSTCTASK